MADTVEAQVFRVTGMHFYGSSPSGRGSDKVWAGVLLKRPAADGRTFCYTAVWGPTGGTMQTKQQPWTTASEATRQYEKVVETKYREGYQDIDWTSVSWGLARPIERLRRSVPVSVANGDAARKAWETRKANAAPPNPSFPVAELERQREALAEKWTAAKAYAEYKETEAERLANEALAEVKLSEDQPPPSPPSPPPLAGRRGRPWMKGLLD